MPAPSDLARLARRALTDHASLILDRAGRPPVPVPPPITGEPLLGLRCAPTVVAVGYCAEIVLHTHDGPQDHEVGVAVDHRGAVSFATPPGVPAADPPETGSPTVDLGLRALGLATPPPERDLASFVDGAWLDRVLDRVLLADLGDPPRWPELSRLHPLGDGTPRGPEELRRARRELRGGWEALRRSVADAGTSGPVMSSVVARWCDTGAFARRMLATVPEPAVVLDDLSEILRPQDAALLHLALDPVSGPT